MTLAAKKKSTQIKTSSTAEYFSKNLQQVGFSSLSKAVLTSLKEAVDNALDACEEHQILPEVFVQIEKLGAGTLKGSDKIRLRVLDNGPGIDSQDVPKVFGEYLASSKFGQGRCSRGQQGIGISAATTYAQLTNATGARVVTKTKYSKKAFSCVVNVDIKNNKGLVTQKEQLDWASFSSHPHGTLVEFVIDGRLQINGEAGVLNYLHATAVVNPHLTLHFVLADQPAQRLDRLTEVVSVIPESTMVHPHTLKLGEFIAYSHLSSGVRVHAWLKKSFSRVNEANLEQIVQEGFSEALLQKQVQQLSQEQLTRLFEVIQRIPLMSPSTKSLLSIGEEGFSKSIQRLGGVDFFSVISRKPAICDFKPVQVEVAIARLFKKEDNTDSDGAVTTLRFANRVPLQFDKAACAIVKAIESVNWKSYGLNQSKGCIPQGPYVIAVSVVSPFIKFKNASKETIDASEDLVAELRRALIQAGQKLFRYLRKEIKENELEKKIRHIEQFCPILVDALCRITACSEEKKSLAQAGLVKILGREAVHAREQLDDADARLLKQEKLQEKLQEKS